MKITKLICYLAIAVTTLSFFSCQKHIQSTEPPIGAGSGSVEGIITDLNNIPVSNATVAGGTATTTTDANGNFTLTKVQFTADTVVINVTKEGFFQGSKNFGSTTKTVKDAKIQLLPKPASSIITASSGGNVTVTGGGSVDFIGGFVNASNGTVYTGNVSVSTVYLNSTDQNFSTSVPGNLKGVNAINQQGVLQSFGVIAVELNDASGNKLQLAQGKTATIALPIPAALLGKAPASIPLWYFDDTKGWWKKEGIATRQGNNYVGVVTHFSFWNVGDIAGSGSVNLTINVTIDTGILYTNKLVTITRPDSTSTNAYTDNTGTVNGLVPVNEVLTLKIFNDCGKNVFSENIGPFNGDTTVNVNVTQDDCVSSDTTQYINMTIGGINYSWPSFKIRESFQADSSTFIMGGGNLQNTDTVFEGMIFGGQGGPAASGSHPIAILLTERGTYRYQAGGMSYDPNYPYPTAVFTKYEAVGGYIEGNFSGWIKTFPSTATADSFALSGSYRVKRIQ